VTGAEVWRADIRHGASARTNSALCPFNLSLRQTRLAQTLGNALKLGKEDDVIGPPRPILQPKGNGVIGPEPTKLGDGRVSFTLMSRYCVSGGEICVGNQVAMYLFEHTS